MKAIIYARYSCDHQRSESIDGQLRECKEFLKRKNMILVNTYIDRAMSAKTDNRPEFQKMIKDSAKGEFDVIIVWKLDRFARNRYDSAYYKAILRKNGVKVLSATEVISEGSEGIILESVLEGYAEYYSAELSEKVIRGMKENALKCQFNGGLITYGYIIDENKHFQVDPVTAPVVVDIFTRYSDGDTIKSITNDLSTKGITNRGKPFTYHFMNGLLKNRRYIGEYTFRDTTVAIPPLVPVELFERCQQRLEDNKHKPASFKPVEEKFLLTGKIFCGYCGTTVSGVGGTSKTGKRHHYYQCVNARKKACDNKCAKKDFVENIVLELTMQIFGDKSLIKRICDTCYSLQSKESTELSALKQQLCQTEKEIDNVMNAIKAGLFTKTTKATLEKLEQEQETLQISITKEQIKRPTISREDIELWIKNLAKTNMNSAQQKQRLIDVFVNSVYVYTDKMVVMFNYKDGEKCLRFDELQNSIKKREHPHK